MCLFKISYMPEVINYCPSLSTMLQSRSLSEGAQKTEVLVTPLMQVIFLENKPQNFRIFLKFYLSDKEKEFKYIIFKLLERFIIGSSYIYLLVEPVGIIVCHNYSHNTSFLTRLYCVSVSPQHVCGTHGYQSDKSQCAVSVLSTANCSST